MLVRAGRKSKRQHGQISPMSRYDAILNFWFEPCKTASLQLRRWFGGRKSMDDIISGSFATDLQKAIAGDYDS